MAMPFQSASTAVGEVLAILARLLWCERVQAVQDGFAFPIASGAHVLCGFECRAAMAQELVDFCLGPDVVATLLALVVSV